MDWSTGFMVDRMPAGDETGFSHSRARARCCTPPFRANRPSGRINAGNDTLDPYPRCEEKEIPMSTQSERKRETHTTTINASDLKDSDFFPPGSGWNKAPREIRDLDLEQRNDEKTQQGSQH